MNNALDSADGSAAVKFVTRKSVVAATCIVVLVLIVLIFLQTTGLYVIFNRTSAEGMGSSGVNTGVILDKGNRQDASKALTTLRYATGFSAQNQGSENNATWTTNQLEQPWCSRGCGAETLVNGRGEPDFWEVSGELGQYL